MMKLKIFPVLALVLADGWLGGSAVAQPVAPLTWSVQNGFLLVNSERRRDFSYASQAAWLRSVMGVADLENYINANRAAYPNLANVIFWGDSGDGLIVMSQTNIQAVHEMLVEEDGWTGSFFDMAYCPLTATGNDLTKYALTVDPVTRAIAKNAANNNDNTMSVWNEWQRWNWISPGY
jgi:hypothetical protein